MPQAQQTTSNMKPAGLVGGGMLASREKYWKELKADEKIERLRTLLKSMVTENSNLRAELSKIKSHKHDEKGNPIIITNLSEVYGDQLTRQYTAYPGAKEDEVYI